MLPGIKLSWTFLDYYFSLSFSFEFTAPWCPLDVILPMARVMYQISVLHAHLECIGTTSDCIPGLFIPPIFFIWVVRTLYG